MSESLVQLRFVLLYVHALLMIAGRLVQERLGILSIIRAAPDVPGWGLPSTSKFLRCSAFVGIHPSIRVETGSGGTTQVEQFIAKHGLPVVIKPDLGHRSRGVHIAFSLDEVSAYLASSNGSVIIQRFSSRASEFSILYVRRFGTGSVISVVQREATRIVADGKRTLRTLLTAIGADTSEFSDGELATVPPTGAPVNASRIARTSGWRITRMPLSGTQSLRATFDQMMAKHAFFFGRFDVKSDSAEALLTGTFDLLEVNGPFSLTLAPLDTTLDTRQAYLEIRSALDHLIDVVTASPSRARLGWTALRALILLRLRHAAFLRRFPHGYEVEDRNL